MVCWRVGAMVGARRGAVAAAGRQHVPPSTAGYHHVGRGYDLGSVVTGPSDPREICSKSTGDFCSGFIVSSNFDLFDVVEILQGSS